MHDEAPSTFVPGMRTLYDPTFGQHNEAFGVGLDSEEVSLPRMAASPDILVGRMTNHLHLSIVAL